MRPRARLGALVAVAWVGLATPASQTAPPRVPKGSEHALGRLDRARREQALVRAEATVEMLRALARARSDGAVATGDRP